MECESKGKPIWVGMGKQGERNWDRNAQTRGNQLHLRTRDRNEKGKGKLVDAEEECVIQSIQGLSRNKG